MLKKVKTGALCSITIMICLVVVGSVTHLAHADSPFVSVSETGLVQNPNRSGIIRDGGASAQVGSKILWTFGDTLFNPASVDGVHARSNSAALADPSSPFSVSEPLDANNAPYQFVPLPSGDVTYNTNSGAGDDRYAIWINSVIPRPAQHDALIYFLRLKISPGNLNYNLLNTGIATVPENSTTATVVVPSLFSASGPLFSGLQFTHDGFTYLSSCTNAFNTQCALARVPLANALTVGSYQFWNGTMWQSDVAQRSTTLPGKPSGWSNALQKYIMTYANSFSSDIYIRTADNPVGPWSDAQKIYTAPSNIYAVEYHSELEKTDPAGLVLTYYQASSANTQGLHTLRLSLPATPQAAALPGAPNSGAKSNRLPIGLAIIGAALLVGLITQRKRLHHHFTKK